jgi:L-iditol 2-dehydrogenase
MTQQTMQALMMTAIKKLELLDVPMPAPQRPDDVLIRVKSVGVCGSDLHGYTGHTGRRIPPLIMGHEIAGEVAAFGDAVQGFTIGERIATLTIASCGKCPQCLAGRHAICENRRILGMNAPGAYAEYFVWPAASVVKLPANLSYEHAALAEPLSIAVHAVGLAHIRPYDTAYIVGAGPIGLLILSVLRHTGVGCIAVSDTSDARLELAHAIGADVTINPTRDNPRAVVNTFTNGSGVDLSFEAVGISATAQQTIDVTRNKGTVIWVGNNQRKIEVDMQAIVTRELAVIGSYGMTGEEFQRCLDMLAAGRIPSEQLINRRATLSEGPTLFDELLASPETIKCVINF